jgi:hypothetical protein
MFGGKEVKSERLSNYITFGVHEVTIKEVIGTTTPNGNPVINVAMYLLNGNPDNANSFGFVLGGGAKEWSEKKLQHLATKIVTKDEYVAATGDTIEEYGEALNSLLSGKSVRIKFTGEERLKQDGSGITIRSNIGLPNFAEAIEEGGEYPVVLAKDTKLVFDKTNEYDYKKLIAMPDISNSTEGTTSDDPGF